MKSSIRSSSGGKVIQLSELNRGLEFSSRFGVTTADSPVNHKHFAYPGEMRNIMIEIEQKKAKGLMEWQKRRLAFQ